MTDQEKIDLLTITVIRLRRHVGLFLRAEIDDVLHKVKAGSTINPAISNIEKEATTAEEQRLIQIIENTFYEDIPSLILKEMAIWKQQYLQQQTAENERLREAQRWIPVTERLPEDGKVYDVVIYWPDKSIQEKREGYIFKEKSFPEERPMFQEASCFGMGLYELTFFLSENLVTHYREWMPLPNKPELT